MSGSQMKWKIFDFNFKRLLSSFEMNWKSIGMVAIPAGQRLIDHREGNLTVAVALWTEMDGV